MQFHQLSRPAKKPFVPGAEQKEERIPRADKDYLRTLETQSLSDMAESLRLLSVNVGKLTNSLRTFEIVVGIIVAFIAILITIKSF